ncbi:MAG: hypothetical protein QOG68_179 [Solirubrobacteraceae bacterium]|nr:hypothetical protein [Solirubrobacteraceae bacterium]
MPAHRLSPAVLAVLATLVLPAAARADQVIADDLAVQGSACVGLDCVDNESFGFDTLRLQENNTRLKFDDTSVGSGFPANDWELAANDSASGGANYFAINDATASRTPFLLTAGAPTNSLFMGATGNVGLGTATPSLKVHIRSGDTPAIRFEQDGGSGFTPQTWDIGANEANFFVRDLTGGSRLPLRLRPGAPTSSIDVAANGNVGLGTASPAQPLHLRRTDSTARIEVEEASAIEAPRVLADLVNNGPPSLRFTNTATGAADWTVGSDGAAALVVKTADPGALDALSVAGGGDLTSAGVLQQSADPATQEAIVALSPNDVLAAIRSLPVNRFQYTADPAHAKHLAPVGAGFRSALGLGATDTALAPGDVAAAALAGVQALAAAAPGAPAGLAGVVAGLGNTVTGHTTLLGQLATADTGLSKRITALSRRNASLQRRLKKLERQVAQIVRRG